MTIRSVFALALLLSAAAVQAQTFPAKPLRVIVPQPPGGGFDLVARTLAEPFAAQLGQPVVVENRPGGGTVVGTDIVAKAEPDGHTILLGASANLAFSNGLYRSLPYNPKTDFVPVGLAAGTPILIVARKDFPAKDLREFVDYLKKNRDRVKQAHGGIGASSHMACLLFTGAIGVKPTLVAYRGTGPAMNDLVGGHVDFFCEQVVSVAPQIAAGAIKAYAVSSSERLPTLPGVPTAKEDGLDYQMSIWAGIFAPKGTPAEAVNKLAAALDKALDDPAVMKRLADLGGSIAAKQELTPESFNPLVKAEIALWSPILKAAAVTQ
ncbi:MAG: Bug family tripartite tricarboxylate transporter substrate binding protein [Sphingomicrobium sp.]